MITSILDRGCSGKGEVQEKGSEHTHSPTQGFPSLPLQTQAVCQSVLSAQPPSMQEAAQPSLLTNILKSWTKYVTCKVDAG